MMNNWIEQLSNLRKGGKALADHNPAVVKAYRGLNEALGEGSALDSKTRELIALAVAVTPRCDGCISSHSPTARQAGAPHPQLTEPLGPPIPPTARPPHRYTA